jgi:hypothetical protein
MPTPEEIKAATEGIEELKMELPIVQDMFLSLGDAVESLFATMITDSANAGKAFAAGLLGGLGSAASAMGDMFIMTGIGMLALQQIQPMAAIAAGIGLKAIAGLMKGAATNIAPASSAATPRGFRQSTVRDDDRRGGINIYVDNFIGNRQFMQDLMRGVNRTARTEGYEEVFFGTA